MSNLPPPPPPPGNEPTPEGYPASPTPPHGQPPNAYPGFPPPPQNNYPNYGQPPVGSFPAPGQPGGMPKGNQKALWSMILGILGFVCCFGILAGIPAIILGYQAKNEVQASGGLQTGEGQAKAGIIMGWIGVGLTILIIVAIVVIGLAGGYESSSLDGNY